MKRIVQRLMLGLSTVLLTAELSNSQTITTFPYSQDFESFASCGTACGVACNLSSFWVNDLGDNIDWTTDVGGTNSTGTGPSVDHNPGTATGKYLYVESSCSGTGFPNMTANLLTPQIDLTGANSMQFEFWYHMFGATMGTMHVDISTDNGVTWTNDITPFWTDNQDLWQQKTVDLGAYTNQIVTLRIRHITTTSFTSDAAIDDVLIYDLLPNDAGIASFVNPLFPACAFNDSVEVELRNYGTGSLTSVTIDWLWNGIPQTQVNWTGSLAPGTSENVYLGSVAYVNSDVIDAATSLPNGVPELPTGAGNDASSVTINTGLTGNYTIGLGGDFSDFTTAVASLTTYGVCGPVVFNAQDGTFTEQITLTEVVGMNATNTVTFQSLNASPALVTLTYNGTSAANNFVVSMDGGDYYTFNNLTITNNALTYGRVIQTGNSATHNTWTGNVISGNANVLSTSNLMALVFSAAGSSLDSMNVFDGNDFQNGSYVFYYYGNGTTSLESGTVITNNTMTDFYYRGLHLYYQKDLTVSGNVLTPDVIYTGNMYRLYLNYCDGTLRVHDNQLLGDQYGYGIYMGNCDASAIDPGYVYNNFIYLGDPALTSTSYGIYIINSNNHVIAFNSVNVESNSPNSRCIYVTGGNQKTVKNNIFKNSGPGYGMYFLSGVTASDNNNIYVPNGVPFYSGGDIADLATWQTVTSFDMSSHTLDPLYVSNYDMHTCQDASIDGGATPDPVVLTDIDGQVRDLNTPDIGADEFLGVANIGFADDTLWKCSSDFITLGGWEPTDDATYLWSTTETTPSISAATATTYFVNITADCGSASPTVVVADIPDAVADFTMIQSFMTAAMTNTSTGAIDTYYWDFGDGTSSTDMSPTHLYADTGVFVVTLTVTGPCGTDVITQNMYSNTVGIDELLLDNDMEVYPNPNNGEFTISINMDKESEVSAELTDPQGKVVWSKDFGMVLGKRDEVVRLSSQAVGVYFLKIAANETYTVRKLTVE